MISTEQRSLYQQDFLNAVKFVGKKMEDAKIVINGAGSAGISICKLLLEIGVGKCCLV